MRQWLALLICLSPLAAMAQGNGLVQDDMEWLRGEGVQSLACPFRDRIDYEYGEIECGLIEVPENREVAGSRSIELHFVRIAATGDEEERRDDPVIYLTGGPGVTVTGYVERLKDHSILEHRDLYILEQRGIGYSGDFCPLYRERNPGADVRDSWRGKQEAFGERISQCIRQAQARGVDVRGYNTFENARDVRALRMALGFDDWNVWGISYGSVLGQALLKVDADGIRAMLIDAIVPLDLDQLMRLPHWYARDLERLFAACEEQPDCARRYEGLESRFLSAIRALQADPLAIEVPESVHFPDGRSWVFQDVIAGLPFGLLYEQSNHPVLPALMARLAEAAEDRDEDFFRALTLADTSGGMGTSMGMGMAVRCLDHYVDEQARLFGDDLEAYPELAMAFGHPEVAAAGPQLCRELGLSPRDREQYRQPRTDRPVLVVNGAWDPITPPPLARYVAESLGNAPYVEFPHAGHGPTRSIDCAGDWMNAWFDDPTAEPGSECVESGEEAADYLTRPFRTRAVVEGVLLKEARPEAMGGQVAWAGVSLLLVGSGFFALGLGWLGSRVNGRRWPGSRGGRLMIFASALSILLWLVGMAWAGWASSELSPALLLVGFVGWAAWFAWLAPLAVILAIAGLVQLLRYREAVSRAGLVGLVIMALGVLGLATFGLAWDLWPF